MNHPERWHFPHIHFQPEFVPEYLDLPITGNGDRDDPYRDGRIALAFVGRVRLTGMSTCLTGGAPVPHGNSSSPKNPATPPLFSSNFHLSTSNSFSATLGRMTQSAIVPANVEGARYDIVIRRGLLAGVGELLSSFSRSKKAAIITDSNVGPLYADSVCQSLRKANVEPLLATIPAGEDHKTLAHISPVYDALLSARIERTMPVLALGGGVIGDMAGFVAATVLRGVPFVQIPTTLLAMVDASVGGKTGINHATGKNLIGAFHQPIAVLVDPDVLTTLPERELRGGLAECIKHDIIRDSLGFAELENDISRAVSRDINYLAGLVGHNVAIKAKVVEADPYEKAERAHLNFGHTFGHAIETVSHYSYSHGECVALGMAAAARAAADLQMLDEISRRRIVSLIVKAGLPVKGLTLETRAVVDAMIFDKKVKGGKVRFVLPDRIGHVVVRDDVPEEIVVRAVESLK
jgi:3-dehydroquinate synthase